MSSNHFTITPMSGPSGTTTVHFRPTGNNDNHYDYRATATVSNGRSSKNISIIQYGVPFIYPQTGGSGATTVSYPSTGGTEDYVVYSHYNFTFSSIPNWVTVQDDLGRTYGEGDYISASTAGIYHITASPNTGSSRTGNIVFRHYEYASALSSATTMISMTQPAGGDAPYFIVSPTTQYLDYYSGATAAFSVATNQEWGVQSVTGNSDKISVQKNTGGNQAIVTNLVHNQSGETFSSEIVFTATTSSSTNYVTMAYEPYLGGYSTTVPQSGGVFGINMATCYDWWFTGLPSWITVTDTDNIVHYEQYTMSNPHSGASLVLRGHADENTTGALRSAAIRLGFRQWDGSTGNTYQEIIVRQDTSSLDSFVIPSPSAITFDSGSTAGTLAVTTVSANTNWSASLEYPNDGYFSLPYGTTGSTGVGYLYIRYDGTAAESASNAILLANSGPTVRVPVYKLKDRLFMNPNGENYPIAISPWANQGLTTVITTTVVSSTPWTATTSNSNFLMTPLTGDAGTTSVSLTANGTYDPGTKYETVVTLTNANGTVSTKTIRKSSVPQLSGYTNSTINYYADGNVIDIDVHTDVYDTFVNFYSPTLTYSVTTDYGEIIPTSTGQQWHSYNVGDNTLHLTLQPGDGWVRVSCSFVPYGSVSTDGAVITVYQYQ